jgi:hypothetical protein
MESGSLALALALAMRALRAHPLDLDGMVGEREVN